MGRRALTLIVAFAICLLSLAGCSSGPQDGSGKSDKTYDLSFSDVAVQCTSRDGFFGGRYADFTIEATVTNETEGPVRESDMPLITTSNRDLNIRPKMSQKRLLEGETCDITYEYEFDLKHEEVPPLIFSCRLTTTGLEAAEIDLNRGIEDVIAGYGAKDAQA